MLAQLHAQAGSGSEAASLLDGLIATENPLVPVPHALMLLAEVRVRSGDREAARAAWQRIVDEFPETEAATRAKERLAE
jgi:TolA-binding protein